MTTTTATTTAFTTRKPTIIDRIKGVIWMWRYQRQAEARRQSVAKRAEATIKARQEL